MIYTENLFVEIEGVRKEGVEIEVSENLVSFIQLDIECIKKLKNQRLKHVNVACAHYSIDHYQPSLFKVFDVDMPPSIRRAVVKRQAEFLAGRILAIKLLKQCGVTIKTLGIGSMREPVWPVENVGSISHTQDYVMVMVVPRNDISVIGCDVENVISEETRKEIADTVLHPQEYQLLSNDLLSKEQLFTLIFSAKESLYKALYPQVKVFFDFHAAKVITIDSDNKILYIILTQTLSKHFKEGKLFQIHFEVLNKNIITYLT